MNNIPKPWQIEHYKTSYPPGTRIELLHMDDPYAPIPPGTKGTVNSVDDIGTLHCTFDNGRILGVIPGEDSFRVIQDTPEKSKEHKRSRGYER